MVAMSLAATILNQSKPFAIRLRGSVILGPSTGVPWQVTDVPCPNKARSKHSLDHAIFEGGNVRHVVDGCGKLKCELFSCAIFSKSS